MSLQFWTTDVNDNGEKIIEVHDLSAGYGGDPAVVNARFEIYAGDRIAIIGPNGAGKSTLIKTIVGILQPQSGHVRIAGGNPQRIGYLPQHQRVNWDFPVTVRDVVMMGRARHIGWMRWPGREQYRAVDAALERVDLLAVADRQVGELSGGQQRRVFIARALAQEADILLLDEPFSGVDSTAQANVMDVLEALNADGITIVLCTHDLNLAFSRFKRVIALRGQIIACGTPQEVYTPAVLSKVYGGRLATWDDGRQVMMFVDDHAHHDDV